MRTIKFSNDVKYLNKRENTVFLVLF